MPRVTCQQSISLDGYSAGPDQTEAVPLGTGGEGLHEWFFRDDPDPVDVQVSEEALRGKGAYVMGRNMFGPVRGAWDRDWRGWWGPEPPYGVPVFVLTHHPRESIEVGRTTFHFVTEGIEAAVARAREVAGDLDVDIAGGASTVRQALNAGLIDDLWVHIAPVLLHGGERFFDGVEGRTFEPYDVRATSAVTHVRYRVG